jgi:hypothetical protein
MHAVVNLVSRNGLGRDGPSTIGITIDTDCETIGLGSVLSLVEK